MCTIAHSVNSTPVKCRTGYRFAETQVMEVYKIDSYPGAKDIQPSFGYQTVGASRFRV